MTEIWIIELAELWQNFRQISDRLDSELFTVELTLDPEGQGSFSITAIAQGTPFPPWAKPQTLQAQWDSLAHGAKELRRIHYHQKEATWNPQKLPSPGNKPKGETA